MTELKTLKDLRSKEYPMSEEQEKMIKAEAVKICKARGNKLNWVDWWDFFNITEEDLKEKKE